MKIFTTLLRFGNRLWERGQRRGYDHGGDSAPAPSEPAQPSDEQLGHEWLEEQSQDDVSVIDAFVERAAQAEHAEIEAVRKRSHRDDPDDGDKPPLEMRTVPFSEEVGFTDGRPGSWLVIDAATLIEMEVDNES